jgi:hypothetical protein
MSGLWSEEEDTSSGTGSERTQVASAADAEAPACQGSRNPVQPPQEAVALVCGCIARRATNGAPSEAAEPIKGPSQPGGRPRRPPQERRSS